MCLGGCVLCVCTVCVYCVCAGNQPTPLSSVESYDPVRRRWEVLSSMPSPRCSCSLLQTPTMMLLLGGVAQRPSDAVEALCLREAA